MIENTLKNFYILLILLIINTITGCQGKKEQNSIEDFLLFSGHSTKSNLYEVLLHKNDGTNIKYIVSCSYGEYRNQKTNGGCKYNVGDKIVFNMSHDNLNVMYFIYPEMSNLTIIQNVGDEEFISSYDIKSSSVVN